jgi:hypothetical protein
MYREIRGVGFAVLRMLALGAVFILALPWIVKILFQSARRKSLPSGRSGPLGWKL